MEINSIGKLEAAKKDAHDEMTLHVLKADADREAAHGEGTSAKNKKPAEEANAALGEKAGGMKGASVKKDPSDGQRPGEAGLVSEREGEDDANDRADEEGWDGGLRDAFGGGRPERFAILDGLAATEE